MIKNLLFSSALLFSFAVFGQTIVSTSPENKNVILEEFTGINCVFCPDGHAIANSIQSNNPGDVFLINVHVGGFATPGPGQPDFRTPFGSALDNQANVAGYPAGTINRYLFPAYSQNPGGTAMGRGAWSAASNQILAQSSYVNVGVEAEIDVNTNQLTVHVEAYYTGNSPQSTNKLNIALLQNNTLGPQVGGDMGDEYIHMHRLVYMLTGQWGVDVNTTTQGSFVDQTFTYTIPNNYNGIPADIYEADFEVVAFITETQQNIISGHGASATYTNLPNNDARLKSIDEIDDVCNGAVTPSIEIQNMGSTPITTMDIQYSVNGESPQVYTWNGNLDAVESDEIDLPEILFNLQATNQLEVSIPDDDNNGNNLNTLDINASDIFETNQFNLSITLDNYPSETTWEITNSSGSVVYSGGPYLGQVGQQIQQTIDLNQDDCYNFSIYDSYGDGICCDYGNGSYTLETASGNTVINGGSFGSDESKSFSNYNTLSTLDYNVTSFEMYPNPSKGELNITASDSFEYQIFNLQGKNILNGQSNSLSKQLNLSELASGIYLVKVIIGQQSKTQKLILK